jgi:hemoglobin
MTVSPNHSRSFALDAREAKRAKAMSIGIDAAYISSFVERFYAHIRDDELLGPIFAERVADWPAHLEQMKCFWRSVLHSSGEFTGSPMRKHVAIPGLEERHFRRWLAIFHETLRDGELHAEATAHVGTTARTIAESLLTGIKLQRHGLTGSRIGKEVFDV